MKFFITTYDKSSYILKHFEYLANIYIPEISLTVLGYKEFPQLSNQFEIISVKKQQKKVSDWAKDYYNYFSKIKDEYVILMMDDMLPASSFDIVPFGIAWGYMRTHPEVGRYELGEGHSWHNDIQYVFNADDWGIYEYGAESLYKISTQPSLWRRECLLKYLNHNWNPWEFELDGSRLADADGLKVIATKGRYAFRINHTISSSRYPDNLNVMSLEKDVIEDMIILGYFERDKLIIGENLQIAKNYE